MRQKVLEFIKTRTSIDILINSVGNFLNVFFTALLALIMVRVMTPVEYGILSVLLGVIYVMTNILDFGVTANIYSSLPNLIGKNREETFRFLKSNFFYQTGLSIIILILLFIFFPYLDRSFLKTGESRFVLNLSAISIIFLIWKNFITNVLLASKKILQINILNNLANLAITIVLIALVYLNAVTITSMIFLFAVFGPIIFFLLLIPGKKDYLKLLIKVKINKKDFKFKYSFTYFLSTQILNLGSRMDLFMLSFYGLKMGVGLYGLSQKIMLTILTTVASITQVLSPDYAKARTQKDALQIMKTSFIYLMIPVGIYLLLVVTPNKLFSIIFTNQYAETALITKSLVLPYILFTLSYVPFLFLLYVARKPIFSLLSNSAYLIGMTLGCYLLIPKLGVYAPAYVFTGSAIIAILILIITSTKEYEKLPK
jgi:PST family polysaccharide transporter